MIILLISFVVSYFLLSVGGSFFHLIYIIHDNVLKVNQNEFFDICLNKKGNLLELMTQEQIRNIHELSDFYHLIIRQGELIQNLDNTKLIGTYLIEIEKLKTNISLTTNDEYVFIDINHLLKRLSEISNDKWVSERFSCDNYRYFSKDVMLGLNRENINETDYCLTIKDNYNEEELKSIYKCKDQETIYEIITIVTNLNSYYKQNEEILSYLENKLIIIENTHNYLIKVINEKTNTIHQLVELYLSLFPSMTEEESLSDLFDCEILREELIAYYDFNYRYVYFYCKLFGIISLAIGILTFVGMTFIINSIQWIDYEINKNNNKNQNEQELEDIIEESDEEYELEDDEKDE
jgi:hypothetical protein